MKAFHEELKSEGILHEILVVNDNSRDNTLDVLKQLQFEVPTLRFVTNPPPRNGFGYAIRHGFDHLDGDVVAIVMGDLSDSPTDVVKFYRKLVEDDLDAVFGSRFMKGGKTIDYPKVKLIINRMANFIVRVAMRIKYNDFTNAFKMYKRDTIEGLRPFLSPHFNLTLELPLKTIIRGYSWAVLPNTWTNRKEGVSKLKITEMGSRYFFVLLYCMIEKFFSKGDFKKDVHKKEQVVSR